MGSSQAYSRYVSDSNTSTMEKRNSSLAEVPQFVIAVVVIIAFIVFYAAIVFGNSTLTVEQIGATFGNIVASIIGYYFGQRPVRSLTRQLERTSGEREVYRDERDTYKGNLMEATSKTDLAEQRLNLMERELENIKSELGLK